MSAWYVLSALGFYPVNPADGNYVFGLLEFPQASIKLTNGKTLQIITHDARLGGHINRASLNGKNMNRVFFTNEQLQSGGTLEFWLSKKSSKWGSAVSAAPPSVTPPSVAPVNPHQ